MKGIPETHFIYGKRARRLKLRLTLFDALDCVLCIVYRVIVLSCYCVIVLLCIVSLCWLLIDDSGCVV